MKAVVKYKEGPGFIRYMDFEEPVPGKGEIKIEVSYAGICGTDLKIRHGKYWSNPPVVLGHEYSGIVAEVGEGVSAFKKGDRVVSETAQAICGKCEFCMSGNYLMCPERLSIGYGTNGAFAKYIVVREEIVHKIPDGINMEEAALCEPAAVSYHSVFDYSNVRPDHTVVVFGPGAIGQIVSRIVGCLGARVILFGTAKDEYRLKIAEQSGIETVISDRVDVPGYIMDCTDGAGAEYAFDCSGAGPAINQALNSLKKKGTLVQVGLTSPAFGVDYGIIPMKELSIRGAFGHIHSSWIGILKMMERKQINLNALVTGKYPLEEWEKAFDTAEDLNAIKVLLHP